MQKTSLIYDVCNNSSHPQELSEVFSDHFDSLSSPVSVSLGLYLEKNIDDVVLLLRNHGINALPYYNPQVADSLDCFVVDGSGVRTPFLTPDDAIKATADIFEIMKEAGISTSRALPVSKENLIPAIAHSYDCKIIDISANNPQLPNVDTFISMQLTKAINEMENVSFDTQNSAYLYRGGTLGDQPYALTFHRRKRDGAYATKDIHTAITYADGVKGAGFKYKTIDGHTYGFMYEYSEVPGQRYYSMAGIENPRGSAECVNHPDNRDDYETLILPSRNPLSAIYLKVDDKVVKIADERGFISDDWKQFAQLHTPYNVSEKNNNMVSRMNSLFSDIEVFPYHRSSTPLPTGNIFYVPNISDLTFSQNILQNSNHIEVKNADLSCIHLPDNLSQLYFTGDLFLGHVSAPKDSCLHLEHCTGIVGITNSDLSNIKEINYPNACDTLFLSSLKLPPDSVLDLSRIKCHRIVFEDMDLSILKDIRLPENTQIDFKGKTEIPPCLNIDGIIASLRKKIAVSHPSFDHKTSSTRTAVSSLSREKD